MTPRGYHDVWRCLVRLLAWLEQLLKRRMR
jgi:hypothetical protein